MKNMLKMLVALGMIVSVTACGGNKKPTSETSEPVTSENETEKESEESEEEKALVVSMATAVAMDVVEDEETGAPTRVAALEGVLVKVEDVIYTFDIGGGRHMAQYYALGSDNYTPEDMYGLEYELAEGETATKEDGTALGYTDIIDVEGRVKTENGKVILEDAKVTFKQEGERTNWYYSGGRAGFDSLKDPQYNGICLDYTVQLVKKPTITTENGGVAKFVFPGEKTNLDSSNKFLVDIIIPAGYTEEQIAKYNETFDQVEELDGVEIILLSYYKNGLKTIMPYSFLGRAFSSKDQKWFQPAELTGLFTNYVDFSEGCLSNYLLDVDLYDVFSPAGAYSFLADEKNALGYQPDAWLNINTKGTTLSRVDVTAYTDEPQDDAYNMYDAITGGPDPISDGEGHAWALLYALDKDYEHAQTIGDVYIYMFGLLDESEISGDDDSEDTSAADSLAAKFILDDSEETSEEEEELMVYAQVRVDVNKNYLKMYMIGETENILSGMKMKDVIDGYDALLSGAGQAKTALKADTFTVTGGAYGLNKMAFAKKAEDPETPMYQVDIYVSVTSGTASKIIKTINGKIEKLGFVKANLGNQAGLYNPTTHEFIYNLATLDVITGKDSIVFHVIVDLGDNVVIPTEDDSESEVTSEDVSEELSEDESEAL